jgi:hypothetical protein
LRKINLGPVRLQGFNHRFFGFYKTWFLIAMDCSVLSREALACALKLRKLCRKSGFLKIKSDSIFAWLSLFSVLPLLTSNFPRNHLPPKKIRSVYIFFISLFAIILLFLCASVSTMKGPPRHKPSARKLFREGNS